jgi:hypothetical protein
MLTSSQDTTVPRHIHPIPAPSHARPHITPGHSRRAGITLKSARFLRDARSRGQDIVAPRTRQHADPMWTSRHVQPEPSGAEAETWLPESHPDEEGTGAVDEEVEEGQVEFESLGIVQNIDDVALVVEACGMAAYIMGDGSALDNKRDEDLPAQCQCQDNSLRSSESYFDQSCYA